jgi:hypothetical protein
MRIMIPQPDRAEILSKCMYRKHFLSQAEIDVYKASTRRPRHVRPPCQPKRKPICQVIFGKPQSQLNPEEYARYRQLARMTSYFRSHEANLVKQKCAKRDTKRLIIETLGLEPVCARCGYDRYIGALDFHHLDPQGKDHDIVINSVGFDRSVAEARKCTLICANCHREAHRDDVPTGAGRPRMDRDPLLEPYMRAAGCTAEQIAAMRADRPEATT